jgi:dolichol kinase
MQAQLSVDSQTIAVELHGILEDLDPSRISTALYDELQTKFQNLQNLIESALERATSTAQNFQLDQLKALLQELADLLNSAREAIQSDSDSRLRTQFLAFRKRLQNNYRKLSEHLDGLQIHVPSLRPTNYRRSIVHACGGLFGLFLIEFLLTADTMFTVASLFFAYAWSMELIRKRYPKFNDKIMAFYGPIAHPHEHHRINSATWYCSALLILSLTVTPMAAAISLVVLGFADPFAALIGRRWGRTRLIHGRSLEGSIAFFVMAFFASVAVIGIWHSTGSIMATAVLGVFAALFGALGELFSGRIDDNFLTPLSTAAGVTIAINLISYL